MSRRLCTNPNDSPDAGSAHPTEPASPACPKPGISPGLLVAIIVAVVLVAICIGAAVAILQQANNGATQSLGSMQSQVLSLASALTDIEGRLGR